MKKLTWILLLSTVTIGNLINAQCYVDRHNTSKSAAWTSCDAYPIPSDPSVQGHWIMYDFTYQYNLFQIHYWNINNPEELDNGLQQVKIEVSEDEITWIDMGTHTFAQGTGSAFYEGEDGPDLGGIQARYLLLTAVSNYGGSCYGLSEIKVGLQQTVAPTTVLAAKAYLLGPYNVGTGLMSDGIRTKNLIPLNEPYSSRASFTHIGDGGTETITDPTVFDNPSDEDDVVDWVFLELRDAVDNSLVVTTRSALLQRDGDIVDIDGISPVTFNVPSMDYYLTIKHRNHLGIMTATPISFVNGVTASIDLTMDESMVLGGQLYELSNGLYAMYGGNANGAKVTSAAQKHTRMTGPGSINDFAELLGALSNLNTNIVFDTYHDCDINMDGNIRMTGPGSINDYAKLYQSVEDYFATVIIQAY